MSIEIAWPIPIFEDFAKALSAALAAHSNSFHSALRTTFLSHQQVATDPENESIAFDLLEVMELRYHLIATSIYYMMSPVLMWPSQSQLLDDDDYEFLNDRIGALYHHHHHHHHHHHYILHASDSFWDYLSIARQCHDELSRTWTDCVHQIIHVAKVLSSAPCITSRVL